MKAFSLLTLLTALCSSGLLNAAPYLKKQIVGLEVSISMQFEATAQGSSDGRAVSSN